MKPDTEAPASSARHLPGQWKCPRCGFHLFRRIFYARTGALGEPTSNDVAEPCPNDGIMLEPVMETVH